MKDTPLVSSQYRRYYLDELYIEPAELSKGPIKQSVDAEDLLREAEEQAGIDEASFHHKKALEQSRTFQSVLTPSSFAVMLNKSQHALMLGRFMQVQLLDAKSLRRHVAAFERKVDSQLPQHIYSLLSPQVRGV